MLEVEISNSQRVEVKKEGKDLLVNGILSNHELIKKTDKAFTLIKESKIYTVELLSIEGKTASISINNQVVSFEVSNHIDKILEELGMDLAPSNLVKEIKAPMPGSILNVIAKENDEVKEGDPILVLEAMKMENVIKSPGDGKVSKIHVFEKENVEKNQVLVTFD